LHSYDRTLRVEYRKVETLIPFARNPRTHSEAQIAKLAASIVEFGWTSPSWWMAATASLPATVVWRLRASSDLPKCRSSNSVTFRRRRSAPT
jgi:hypothetical protein